MQVVTKLWWLWAAMGPALREQIDAPVTRPMHFYTLAPTAGDAAVRLSGVIDRPISSSRVVASRKTDVNGRSLLAHEVLARTDEVVIFAQIQAGDPIFLVRSGRFIAEPVARWTGKQGDDGQPLLTLL